MAFTPPAYFATIPWAEREGDDQGDPEAALLEIRPGELDCRTTALRRIWYQYRSTTTWPVLLGLVGDAFALLENGQGSVAVARWVSTAEGLVLDEIGALVDQPRGGLDDDLYRLAIRARAASLATAGTIPEIVEISRALLSDQVRVQELWPATVAITSPDVATDIFLLLLQILDPMLAAGVAGLLSTYTSALVGGWASTTDPGFAEVTDLAGWTSTTGTDADDALSPWSTGQPIGGE